MITHPPSLPPNADPPLAEKLRRIVLRSLGEGEQIGEVQKNV